MGIDPVYLVCVDCDQIQAYIFFSARHLLTIDGASRLIEKASCRPTMSSSFPSGIDPGHEA